MLRDRPELFLPPVKVTVMAVDAFEQLLQESETLFEGKHVTFETCQPGQVINDVSPDLVGTLRGRQLLIELTVFHRLMPEKRTRLQQTGLAILELDLSEFKTKQATRERLEDALFMREDNRRWVWHPARAGVEARLKESLNQRLAAAETEWAAQEKKAQAERADALALYEALQDSVQRQAPVSYGTTWRAAFPAEETWAPARAAFCERHSTPREKVDAVFGAMTKRSELALTTPTDLAQVWAEQLGVTEKDIFRYFGESAYVI